MKNRQLHIAAKIVALGALGLIVDVALPGQSAGLSEHVPAADCELVTFIELIAEPESYDGKCIKVAGVLAVGFEENMLYMSWELYKSGLLGYAFPVDVPIKWLPDDLGPLSRTRAELVSIEGIFRAYPREELHSGRIVDVRHIMKLS